MSKRKLFWAKTAVILGVIPVLMWAYEYGPDAGYSGVPKENGTCNTAGCHTGTTLNGGKGSVSAAFPNGMTYTPGVKQHLVVTIADPAQHAWGFQLTARPASNTGIMAGSFVPTDTHTLLMCAEGNLFVEQALCLPGADTGKPGTCIYSSAPTCPSGYGLQYIEHSAAGYFASRGQSNSGSYEFDWTPPSTNAGNVTIYVAGNAANGDLTQDNDHIYSATYTLTPAAAGNGPTIASEGVQNGASFQDGIVPGSWFTIKGTNLSSVTDTWANAIVNGKLPTTLDSVSVSVGGQPAYVYYVSAGQINAVAPNVGTGSMIVAVTADGATTTATVTAAAVQPAFFLWPNSYVVATHLDGTWAVKNGTFPTVNTVPAKPGEYVVMWATGFGPTSPAAPVGMQTPSDQVYVTANPVSVTVNGASATVYSDHGVLAPGFAGLYQLNVQIPSNAPDGDLPVVASINGAQSPGGILLNVQH